MTNREKFAEQILDIACGGSKIAVDKATLELTSCYKLACGDCLFRFGNGDCRGARKKWANSEYVRIGGADDISNYMPACRSCNHYKATLDIEGFRDYLSRLHKRLMRDSIPYQVAERFGIVKHVSDNVKFYFEELRGGEDEERS